ncbi:hypothetical protein EJB05_26382, partial [Eragrostis curvula]
MWLKTLECLLLKFLLPRLPRHFLQHLVFQCLLISLLKMLIGTFNSSSVRVETPEETLSRIAYGGFGGPVNATTSGGGPVNATTSGGGNYSPPEDQFPLSPSNNVPRGRCQFPYETES